MQQNQLDLNLELLGGAACVWQGCMAHPVAWLDGDTLCDAHAQRVLAGARVVRDLVMAVVGLEPEEV